MKTIQGGSRAEFMFSSGHAVVFQSINDITALVK